MSEPVRHHYIPQFLLRNFADPQNRLWVLRKDTKTIFQASTKAIFYENHLYSKLDGGQYDAALEKLYSKLESQAAPIVARIVADVRSDRLPTLTKDEREVWSQFYYQQMKRVPEFHGKLESIAAFKDRVDAAITQYETKYGVKLSPEQIADLRSEESVAFFKKNATVQALADPGPKIMSLLMAIGIQFARAAAPLLIGSQPIARLSEGQSMHLADPNVEAWLPLASDIAIRPLASTTVDTLVELAAVRVGALNQRVFEQSLAVAAELKSTLDALTS